MERTLVRGGVDGDKGDGCGGGDGLYGVDCGLDFGEGSSEEEDLGG